MGKRERRRKRERGKNHHHGDRLLRSRLFASFPWTFPASAS